MELSCGWIRQGQLLYDPLGRYILTALVLNLKLSEHVIKSDDVTLKGSIAPMIDFCTYDFKDLNIGEITPMGVIYECLRGRSI